MVESEGAKLNLVRRQKEASLDFLHSFVYDASLLSNLLGWQ
jgi:hypothetical protein